LIIPRLRAQCPIFSGRVFGAATYAAAADQVDVSVPCAFVIPAGDSAQPDELISQHLQIVDDRFAVVVCVSNTADDRGQDGAEQLHDVRAQIIAALCGWSPDANTDPVNYAGAEADPQIDRARIWHSFDFSAVTRISA
jgi:hypothetical protein